MRTSCAYLCLALAACSAEPPPDPGDTGDRCAALRDHLAELRGGEAGEDGEQHRRAMAAALGEDFAVYCAALDDSAIECGLAAGDADTARDCLGLGGE